MRRRKRVFAAAVVTALVAGANLARAQPRRSDDPALAQALFDDAKALMTAGNLATACPKFAESYRLDPAEGTLMGLALCHEGEGKAATAWAEFLTLSREAKRSGRADRERLAREHAAKLESHLSRLTIKVQGESNLDPGFEVTRDGARVVAPAWATAVPVDPGPHVVEATAPGREPWRAEVTIDPADDNVTVSIPRLTELGAAAAPIPEGAAGSTEPSTAPARSFPVAAVIIGGAGLVATGVGAYFGVRALSENHDARADCSPSSCTDPNAVATSRDAVRDATVSDIGIGVGVVGLALGLYLLLTSHGRPHDAGAGLVVPAFAAKRGALSMTVQW